MYHNKKKKAKYELHCIYFEIIFFPFLIPQDACCINTCRNGKIVFAFIGHHNKHLMGYF